MKRQGEDRIASEKLREAVDGLLRTWWATALCEGVWPVGLDRSAFDAVLDDAERRLRVAERRTWQRWRNRTENLTLHPIDRLLQVLHEQGLKEHPAHAFCLDLRARLSRQVVLRTIPEDMLADLRQSLWAAVEHVAKALMTAHPSTTHMQWTATCKCAHGAEAETPDGLEPVLAHAMSLSQRAADNRDLLDDLAHLVAQLALHAVARLRAPSKNECHNLEYFMLNLYELRRERDENEPGSSVHRRFEDMRSGRLKTPKDGLTPLRATIVPIHDQRAFCAVARDLRGRHPLVADLALIETVLQWHPRAGPTPDRMPRTVEDFGSRLADGLRQLRVCRLAGWPRELPVLTWLADHHRQAVARGEHDWSRHYEGFNDARATLHGRLPNCKSGRASVVDLKPWNAKLGITFRRAVDDALARLQGAHADADPVLLGRLVHAVFSVPRLPKPDHHYHDFPGWPALYLCVMALARNDNDFDDRWLKPLVALDLDTRPDRSLCDTSYCDGLDGGNPYCCATT